MSEDLGSIYYDVDANLEPLIDKTARAEKSVDDLTKGMKKSEAGSKKMRRGFDETEKGANRLSGELNGLTRVIRGVIAAMALKEAASMIQSYQEMAERVQMATDSMDEFDHVQQRLQKTADGTYRRLSEAQELYIRTADSLRALGYSTNQAMDVQDSLSYMFVTNATSADRANSAISAFTGALNTGRVGAMQYQTIVAAVPTIIDDVAEATGRTVSEVRALGAAGQLTAQDLTEGLRQSLEANSAAAEGMSNNLTDAGVRVTGAMTSMLVALEAQYGALDTFTNAIITASNWLQELAGNTDAMGLIAKTLEVGVVSLAAVIAGRLVMSVYASSRAWLAKSASMGVATTAANALRASLTLLGGPAGILFLVAGAFLTLGNNAANASEMTELLTRETKDLSKAQRDLYQMNLASELEKQGEQLEKLYRTARTATGATMSDLRAGLVELPTAAQASIDGVLANIDRLEKRMAEVSQIGAPEAVGGATGGDVSLNRSVSASDEFKKMETSLQEQIALAKRTGLARAELAALQKLGSEATEEERDRIAQLVGELHNLEQAAKAADEAERERLRTSEESRKAAEANADVLANLREQLYQTTLEGEALVQRQAELSLNSFATPEHIEEVRALAAELYNAQQQAAELERRKSIFGDDAAGSIRGSVSPLSGGAFDDQAMRYEAEEAAEVERYAAQLERLSEAKEMEIEVIGGYQALEEQMAQEHADRMAQIEQAKMDLMLKSGEQGFGAMADIMKAAYGEQSTAYKVAFAAQKAFAVAQSVVAITTGIAMAAANPWPANLAAMASVAAATAGLVSTIASVKMQGGRMAGGLTQSGGLYRINEGGAPEVFNGVDGHQYMIANQRGEVVSNRDAKAGGGGSNIVVNLIEDQSRAGSVTQSQTEEQTVVEIVVASIRGDGEVADAISGKYALESVGR